MGYATVTEMAATPLALRGACGIVVAASGFNVKTGAYPLGYALVIERPAIRLPGFARELTPNGCPNFISRLIRVLCLGKRVGTPTSWLIFGLIC